MRKGEVEEGEKVCVRGDRQRRDASPLLLP